MQPIKQLAKALGRLADKEHFLFSPADLNSLFPRLSSKAFYALITNNEKEFKRVKSLKVKNWVKK